MLKFVMAGMYVNVSSSERIQYVGSLSKLHIPHMSMLFSDDGRDIVYQQSRAHHDNPDHVSGLFPICGWEASHQ
jgi:hypothetical protein